MDVKSRTFGEIDLRVGEQLILAHDLAEGTANTPAPVAKVTCGFCMGEN